MTSDSQDMAIENVGGASGPAGGDSGRVGGASERSGEVSRGAGKALVPESGTSKVEKAASGQAGPVALDESDCQLIRLLSLDLGRSAAPYREIAEKLGWDEDRVIKRVKEFGAKGIIRRMAGVLVHQRTGFTANAMVVWRVDPGRLDGIGRALAGFACVSHCYWRPEVPGWPYNLYTMVHARGPEELEASVKALAAKAGDALVGDEPWLVLTSLKELKKSSLEYFPGYQHNSEHSL